MKESKRIERVESEASVVSSLFQHPEFSFYSEDLLPSYFSDTVNRFVYQAVCSLTAKGATQIDAIAVNNELSDIGGGEVKLNSINQLIESTETLARHTPEDYRVAVEQVRDAAFRRDMRVKLRECADMCLDMETSNIEQHVYQVLDAVMVQFSSTTDIPQYKDVVDKYWEEIENRQDGGFAGIPFKFSCLNDFATIERGELFIFGAEQKQGKSIMLLNCAVDLLKKGYAVLYLDSELNSRLFTARLLAHLTGIEYRRITTGAYTEEEKCRIIEAKDWLKTCRFTHIYIPSFDAKSIYTTVKKVQHTQGLDVLVVDYFKSKSDGDAFDSYQQLGKFTDTVKNQICGELNIAGIGAAQATSTGRLADSAKIARNASTIAMITSKTPDEIASDGPECGNKKLHISFNRNGMQHADGEYIDLMFDGNHILYEQARQHIPHEPY